MQSGRMSRLLSSSSSFKKYRTKTTPAAGGGGGYCATESTPMLQTIHEDETLSLTTRNDTQRRNRELLNEWSPSVIAMLLFACIFYSGCRVILFPDNSSSSTATTARRAQHMFGANKTHPSSMNREYWDGHMSKLGQVLLSSKEFSFDGIEKWYQPSITNNLKKELEQKLDELLYFNNSMAYALLKESATCTSHDFYEYQQGWDAQVNQAYCAVASSAAVLNSLRGHIALPTDPVYKPFPYATQHSLLVNNDCVVQNVINKREMDAVGNPHLFFGLGISMVKGLLDCHLSSQGYVVDIHIVDPSRTSVDSVKQVIKDALFQKDTRVIMNYDRGGIGQDVLGHGHFSPIGAYNHVSDSFLVMDVAKYKHPAVWVPSTRLYNGMATTDRCAEFTYPPTDPDFSKGFIPIAIAIGCQPSYRGFLIIRPDK